MPRCVVIDGFVANAANFDGSDYLSRGSNFSGIADGDSGLFSCWFRIGGSSGTSQVILNLRGSGADSIFISRNTLDKFSITARSSAPAIIVTYSSTASFTSSSTWHHIIASWNSSTFNIYVDGVDDSAGGAQGPGNVDYTSNPISVGAYHDGTRFLSGDLAELYLDTSFIDLNLSANREKFRTASGKPADLGYDGALPTGSQPFLYLANPAASFHLNRGKGGDFTVAAGALSASSSSPSD